MTTSKNSKDKRPDKSLWSNLSSARTRSEYFRSWLALQFSLIPGAVQSVLVLKTPDDGEGEAFVPECKYPEVESETERLVEVTERMLEERCGLVMELPARAESSQTGSGKHYGVAYPITLEGETRGAIVVEVLASRQSELKAVMEQLQWGVVWIESYFLKGRAQDDIFTLKRLKLLVEVLAALLKEESFESGAMAFVTSLATEFDLERVSYGIVKKKSTHVETISHSSRFTKSMNLVRSIGLAMDEAILQGSNIQYPPRTDTAPDGEALITREHEELIGSHGTGSVLTIPILANGVSIGAITFERSTEDGFSDEEVKICKGIVSLGAPVLETLRKKDRSLTKHVADSARSAAAKMLGPGYIGRKVAALLLAVAILLPIFIEGDYRVSSDASLEGALQRVVAAPFNGFIEDAYARAGDVVSEGALLCVLEDKDLRLERLNLMGQRSQYERQRQEAFAKHDRANLRIIGAQLEQVDAELSLIESKLKRASLRMPFEGLLVSGDLSQRLGGSVEKGEVLFEVAPLDSYRVILEVDERRIADIDEGQRGVLVLSSLSGESLDFTVMKIIPIAIAEEGNNYFRVEAELDNVSERLRPGMEGVGKVYVDRRKLISIWTRSLTEWVRLWVWKWIP